MTSDPDYASDPVHWWHWLLFPPCLAIGIAWYLIDEARVAMSGYIKRKN